MDQAATFLVGSILSMLGIVVVVIGVVVINNIIHKYWKPIKIFTPDSWSAFNPPMSEDVKKNEPIIEKTS